MQLNNMNWPQCALPADGHGDDDWLPAGVEEFSCGGNLPRYQHPQGAHGHKHGTHQWVGIVIVLCTGRTEFRITHISDVLMDKHFKQKFPFRQDHTVCFAVTIWGIYFFNVTSLIILHHKAPLKEVKYNVYTTLYFASWNSSLLQSTLGLLSKKVVSSTTY